MATGDHSDLQAVGRWGDAAGLLVGGVGRLVLIGFLVCCVSCLVVLTFYIILWLWWGLMGFVLVGLMLMSLLFHDGRHSVDIPPI